MLTGHRTFEVAQGWGGNHAWGPAFVLTHHIPAGWARPNSTIHFVTNGLESAVNQSKAAAAGKSVGVHGADTIQQLLNAGLLDEISVDVAAVLNGSGVRLFDQLARTPSVLGNPTVIQGVGVTHLRFPAQGLAAVLAVAHRTRGPSRQINFEARWILLAMAAEALARQLFP